MSLPSTFGGIATHAYANASIFDRRTAPGQTRRACPHILDNPIFIHESTALWALGNGNKAKLQDREIERANDMRLR